MDVDSSETTEKDSVTGTGRDSFSDWETGVRLTE